MPALRWLLIRPTDVGRVILLLWLLIAIGLIALVAPAGVRITQGNWPGALTVIGTGLFLAGAATLVGSLIGFLFGVPRRGSEPEGTKEDHMYRPNTNLEQVSDWPTKIIIGIGLTQFPEIVSAFSSISAQAGPAFGDPPSGQVIALSIALHYSIVGFFNGFLLAYLWLPNVFARASA
jgi:hypothetical protein